MMEPSLTPSGAAYPAPGGWARTALDSGCVYTAPEGDLRLAIVEPEADGAVAAAAAALTACGIAAGEGGAATADAPRSGWREIVALTYPTPPAARRWLQAVAFRGDAGWTVVVLDGAMATFEKRGAAAMAVLQGLAAPGFQREDFGGRPAHPLDADRIAALEAFVRDAMRQLQIPGVAFALVDRHGVLAERGLGVASVVTTAPVTAATLFPIASNTKGLTTLLLAALVDEGKLAWDDIAADVYPAFRLGSAELTRRLRIRDLVSAATGLPRKDMVWSFTNRLDTKAARIFEMLATAEPTSGFGEVFQYNNLMAAAAGFIAGAVAYPGEEPSTAYDKALATRLLGPLGMEATTFDLARVRACAHVALHGLDDNGTVTASGTEFGVSSYASRPSGGAWSSAADMIRYVQLELLEGRLPDGRQLVSAANLLARRAPGVAMGAEAHYGMGLIADQEVSVRVIRHGGSTPGAMSDIFILPEAGVGAVLLTNADAGAYVLNPFKRRLVELLYDAEPRAAQDVAAAAARIPGDLRRSLATTERPALPAGLSDRYTSEELGDLGVAQDGDTLLFGFAGLRFPMRVRREAEGSRVFVTAHPIYRGIAFVEPAGEAGRALLISEGQYQYHFAATGRETR